VSSSVVLIDLMGVPTLGLIDLGRVLGLEKLDVDDVDIPSPSTSIPRRLAVPSVTPRLVAPPDL
jgi:hypothetical protein